MTIPEYIDAASRRWMDDTDKSLFCFCNEVGIDAGKEWCRMMVGERAVSVKVLFRVQSVSRYSLDHLDPRYNNVLERLPDLKKWRQSRGLSQCACAGAIGMSVQSFDTLESTHRVNHCSFRAEKLLKVADLLNGVIVLEPKVKPNEHYADVENPPKKDTSWDIQTATDAEIMDRVDKVWRYAMFGKKRAFHLQEKERGLFVGGSEILNYIVDVRKVPALFRATIRSAGMTLCERYI